MRSRKYQSTIDLEIQIKEYVDTKDIFWYDIMLTDLNITGNTPIHIAGSYIKKLCSNNYICPCGKIGNHTQYMKI